MNQMIDRLLEGSGQVEIWMERKEGAGYVDFKIWERSSDREPLYAFADPSGQIDFTDDRAKAPPQFWGRVRFDSTVHLYAGPEEGEERGYVHTSAGGVLELAKALEFVMEKAEELFGDSWQP